MGGAFLVDETPFQLREGAAASAMLSSVPVTATPCQMADRNQLQARPHAHDVSVAIRAVPSPVKQQVITMPLGIRSCVAEVVTERTRMTFPMPDRTRFVARGRGVQVLSRLTSAPRWNDSHRAQQAPIQCLQPCSLSPSVTNLQLCRQSPRLSLQ